MTNRRIVAGLFISADGVVGAPEQWTFQHMTEEAGAVITGLIAEADTLLLGRATYEEFAAHWASQTGPMADAFNGMRKLVASTTLTAADWNNSEILTGDLAARLTELKNTPGRNINISGSICVVRTLLAAGLLDDLHLMVFPIVLGTGTRLFPDEGKRVDLALAGTRTFDTGVVHLHYQTGATR
ncbi:dihydrofolate reductase family protein [Kibdelosporangium persicum]|uniref:Riboflavin biosynthesis protein RibD n=1 Tax=Kibdelosporangium persicum TaxID=2698649 RepID=A0ABX2F498_9PSEU|nr:dihydrofolate reductase family protein [Kibdelosporangium persicum]NRN65825.1 Riboflavin biosynthesis protein RibD [Kibdelosporangium persicum]